MLKHLTHSPTCCQGEWLKLNFKGSGKILRKMDPSKLVPEGSLRQHAVLTLKEKGDVAKVKEEFRKVLEETQK